MSYNPKYEIRYWGNDDGKLLINHLSAKRERLEHAVELAKKLSIEDECDFVAVTDVDGKHRFGPIYFRKGVQTNEHPEVLKQNPDNYWVRITDIQIDNIFDNLSERNSTEYLRRLDFEDLYNSIFENRYPLYSDFVAVASVMLTVFDKNHKNPTKQDYKKFIFGLLVFFDSAAANKIEKNLMSYDEQNY